MNPSSEYDKDLSVSSNDFSPTIKKKTIVKKKQLVDIVNVTNNPGEEVELTIVGEDDELKPCIPKRGVSFGEEMKAPPPSSTIANADNQFEKIVNLERAASIWHRAVNGGCHFATSQEVDTKPESATVGADPKVLGRQDSYAQSVKVIEPANLSVGSNLRVVRNIKSDIISPTAINKNIGFLQYVSARDKEAPLFVYVISTTGRTEWREYNGRRQLLLDIWTSLGVLKEQAAKTRRMTINRPSLQYSKSTVESLISEITMGDERESAGFPIDSNILLPRAYIQLRDIRVVDPLFHSKSTIWARKGSIIVNLDSIQCILTHDQVYFFLKEGDDSKGLSSLVKHLTDSSDSNQKFIPFEFRTLEAILIYVLCDLESTYASLAPVIKSLLHSLDEGVSMEAIKSLRKCKENLSQFERRTTEVRQVLLDLVENEGLLTSLYLTFYSNNNYETAYEDPEEAELLFEAYLQDTELVHDNLKTIRKNIEDAEDTMTIQLDSARNTILFIDLSFSIVSACCTCGGMLAGLFGMNLNSGIDNQENTFWPIFWGSMGFVVIVPLAALIFLKRMNILNGGISAAAKTAARNTTSTSGLSI